jgi:carbamoyl-phosphate synthase small subunit
VQVAGLVISDYSSRYSHWSAGNSLHIWLKENDVPAIFGVDTRFLTKRIRTKGTMLGKLLNQKSDIPFYDPNRENLVSTVSVEEKKIYGNGKLKVLLLDCGVKNNIIRCLLARDCTVITVPWNHDISREKFDGLLISNGPGNPEYCRETITGITYALDNDIPIFGICLGNQLLALAAGGKVFKLKYGHRSHNQPVLLKGTNRAFITSQNHGYAVDTDSLPQEWKVLFTNINDGTVEGIKHRGKPFFSVQFHPEASGGPSDTMFLFDDFIQMILKNKRTGKI